MRRMSRFLLTRHKLFGRASWMGKRSSPKVLVDLVFACHKNLNNEEVRHFSGGNLLYLSIWTCRWSSCMSSLLGWRTQLWLGVSIKWKSNGGLYLIVRPYRFWYANRFNEKLHFHSTIGRRQVRWRYLSSGIVFLRRVWRVAMVEALQVLLVDLEVS